LISEVLQLVQFAVIVATLHFLLVVYQVRFKFVLRTFR
jgi:hypothetical protein